MYRRGWGIHPGEGNKVCEVEKEHRDAQGSLQWSKDFTPCLPCAELSSKYSPDLWQVAFTSDIPGATDGSGFPCFYKETIHPLNFPWATEDSFISGRDVAPPQGQVLPLGLSSNLHSSLKVQQA